MIGRREFITLLGGAAASWPVVARAEQAVASTLDSIEQAFNRHGVMAFSTPTPGVRLL